MNTLGRDGEALAIQYFRNKGYRILEKNFRTAFGEIDLIARDNDTLVFIEVKTRADRSFGYPFEAVHPRKRNTMKKVALFYLKKLRKELPARFDVLSIELVGGKRRISHIQDAFEV